MNRKYILIVGSGRTSTTALSKIFADSNNSIAYLPELKFFFVALSNRKNIKDPVSLYSRTLSKFLKFNSSYSQQINFNKSVEKFQEIFSNKKMSNNEMYKFILDFLIDETLFNKLYDYYILQTPGNLFMLDLKDKVLSNKYIIYTVRDSRSFISSAYCGKRKFADNLIKVVVYWNYCAKVLKLMMKKYQGILIKQEELLLNEEEQIHKISNFLSIPLDYKEQTNLINSSFEHKNKEETLFSYKKFLTDNDIKMVESFTQRYFEYEERLETEYPNLKITLNYYLHYFKTIISQFLRVNGYSNLLYKIKK